VTPVDAASWFQGRTTAGSSVAIPRKTAQKLLAFLAFSSDPFHRSGELAALLWSGAPEVFPDWS